MPSNLLNADVGFPQLNEEQRDSEKINKIVNYLYMLLEQLRYSFGNMDKDNFSKSGLDELEHLITDPVYMRMEDDEGNIAALFVTAQGLGTRMTDAEGNISQLTITASNLTSRMSNAEGSISTLTQTATSLQTQVTNAAGAASTAQQTANSITFDVTNGTDRSYIYLYRNGVLVNSETIRFTGDVIFASDLYDGTTLISGDNIQTGSIAADYIGAGTIYANSINLRGLLSVQNGSTTYGYVGCGYGYDGSGYTNGAFLGGPNNGYGGIENYFIATNSGARMQAGTSSIFVVPGGCYSSSEIHTSSDRRVKKDMRYDMERYEAFFMALKPCAYKKRAEENGRYHTGFIAQEVEQALADGGLTYDDFDALQKDPNLSPEYSLAYGEFAALNVWMIQKLAARVTALEEKMNTEG